MTVAMKKVEPCDMIRGGQEVAPFTKRMVGDVASLRKCIRAKA